MPCDTPPPPSSVDDLNEDNGEDVDDSLYDFIEDASELEIVEDDGGLTDDSIMTFDAHKDSVFCCNFDRTGDYIVTGGQDETAFVWNVRTKTVKFECTGHTESVVAASFSPDSKYVATADMDGLVQLFNMEDGSLVFNFETIEIQWLKWQNGENSFIVGGSDGNCLKWTVPDLNVEYFSNPNTSCCTGAISHDDQKLVTGYLDGTLKLWSIPNKTVLSTLSGAHKTSIITVKFNADSSLILTGSEDGTAKVIKASDFKVLWTINGCDSSQHDHESVSVEDVAFCHSLPYIAVGTNCGVLSIWDMNTKTRRTHTESTTSIIKIKCDNSSPIIYVAIADGTLQAHDARTGDTIKHWHGHKAAILDLALSSDYRLLLTASDDHTCKLFQSHVF